MLEVRSSTQDPGQLRRAGVGHGRTHTEVLRHRSEAGKGATAAPSLAAAPRWLWPPPINHHPLPWCTSSPSPDPSSMSNFVKKQVTKQANVGPSSRRLCVEAAG
jgi:hypothetical protein